MECIPLFCGIGALGICTIYQVHLSSKFMGNFMDKIYFYYAHLITCIPIILYIYALLDIFISNIPFSLRTMYIEWAFTTPLILMNVSRLIKVPITQHILITTLDLCMILSGYISYISQNKTTIYVSYSIGCFIYILLFLIFLRNLSKSFIKSHLLTNNKVDKFSYKVARFLIVFIAFMWILYPITHILYKIETINTYTVICIYVGLDVLGKGIFTNLLLGAREIYSNSKPPSFIACCTKKIVQVYPMETEYDTAYVIDINNRESIIS